MRNWNYYSVSYPADKLRFETLDQQEAENYAQSLFARSDEMGTPPVIEEHTRSSDK